ncbi:MAG TPA: U32 family peptidase [Methanobacterium sp.]
MVVKIVELLSPARDFAALKSAISNGADSVYLGLTGYNMRANAVNFGVGDLKKAVKCCHDSNVRLYVCTNTMMKDGDIKALKSMVTDISSSEADALIVSDLGALQVARENDMSVHMSVQSNISNVEALKLLGNLGVSRVILSRELSLFEIKNMAEKTSMELEVFVHGAMCMAVSGRCFLSSYLYEKSANCGECLQPCRKEWKLLSEDHEELKIIHDLKNDPVMYKGRIFSPRDLCMVEYLPELMESGVSSFKIEGRARPAEYVATVTRVYREAINKYESGWWEINEEWIKELKKVYNRGFDTGFYFKTPTETSKYNQSTHLKRDIGEVCNYYRKVRAAEIRLWDDLEVGDEILIQGNATGSLMQYVESIEINGESIEKAKRGQNVGINVKDKVRPNDVVYKRIKRV